MRILIVDNHILFREGLVSLLENQSDITVVGAISNSESLLEEVRLSEPDFIIMDLEWPDLIGVNMISEIQQFKPQTKVIILTHKESDELLLASIRSGARGFLLKDIPVSKLVATLRAIEAGEIAIPRRLISPIIDEFNRMAVIHLPRRNLSTAPLTQRELEIFRLLSKGATNQQIAKQLSISINTVKIHIHHILRKLQLRNRTETTQVDQSSI